MKKIQRKPQKSGNKVERDKSGKFQIGHQKLGGIQKGTKHFKTEIDRLLNQKAKGLNITYREALLKKVVHKMVVDGDNALIREYWQQSDGRPTQGVEIKDYDEMEELREKINKMTQPDKNIRLLSNVIKSNGRLPRKV